MKKGLNKQDLLKLIESLKISKDEFTILPSSALVLRGIYESAGDLDIAVTQTGLSELKRNYNLILKENNWYKLNYEVECILDDMVGKKEKFDEYFLQDIYDYLAYLETSNREKDKQRIIIVKEYIKTRKYNKWVLILSWYLHSGDKIVKTNVKYRKISKKMLYYCK